MSTVASPTSADRSARASARIPAGSSAAEPRASLTAGTPKSMSPPTPASTASAAALRRLSLVCWTTPGMEATGCGSRDPLLDEERQHQVGRLDAGLGDEAPHGGGAT